MDLEKRPFPPYHWLQLPRNNDWDQFHRLQYAKAIFLTIVPEERAHKKRKERNIGFSFGWFKRFKNNTIPLHAGLVGIKLVVTSFFIEQFLVLALFSNFSLFDDQDLIGFLNGT